MGKFTLLYHDYGTRGLMGEGRLFKFNLNGKPIGESALDFNCMSSEEVDVLSVLVTNGNYIELGFNIRGVFSKRVYTSSLSDLVRRINSLNGLVFMGTQSGKVGEDVCNQYLYAFKQGYITEASIN